MMTKPLAFAILLLSAAPALAQQSVSDVLGLLVTSQSVETGEFERDRAAAEATNQTISRALLGNLATLPVSKPVLVPLGAVVTPYRGAGVGAGKTYTFDEEDEGGEVVYSLGVGARVAFSEQLGLVVDARMRDISNADGDDHTDVSVGLRYQFRPTDRPRFRGARP